MQGYLAEPIGVTVEKTNPEWSTDGQSRPCDRRDEPSCGSAATTNTSRSHKFNGDSCRVKAGETRYPPADGRQEGHQKVTR